MLRLPPDFLRGYLSEGREDLAHQISLPQLTSKSRKISSSEPGDKARVTDPQSELPQWKEDNGSPVMRGYLSWPADPQYRTSYT